MADGTYDLVLCSQVLEHIPEPVIVLKEIRRVLKPDGQAWLSAPLFYEEHETPYDFHRYTQFAWRRMAAEAGFTVESLEWLEGYYGTISYQLMMASYSLSMIWLPLKAFLFVFAQVVGFLDIKFKVTNTGMPKNYRCVLRPRKEPPLSERIGSPGRDSSKSGLRCVAETCPGAVRWQAFTRLTALTVRDWPGWCAVRVKVAEVRARQGFPG